MDNVSVLFISPPNGKASTDHGRKRVEACETMEWSPQMTMRERLRPQRTGTGRLCEFAQISHTCAVTVHRRHP
jgi:hypothetical protein